MRAPTDTALFGIVVYESVESIDIGATYGVLSMARRLLPQLKMVVVAEESGLVEMASGLRVVADHGFADCPRLDVAIVCGGSGWGREGQNPAMLSFLHRAVREFEVLASVCTGGMILGAAGLLDNRRATTRRHAVGAESKSPLARLAEMRPQVACVEAAVVDAGAIVTGGGVTLAVDTTLHLISRLYGPTIAAEVAAMIEYAGALEANRRAVGVVADS
jgi:transcriptional regulator GlxA family with amidase domain